MYHGFYALATPVRPRDAFKTVTKSRKRLVLCFPQHIFKTVHTGVKRDANFKF